VARATDRNSEHELANLKAIAENLSRAEELTIVFDDTVEIEAARPDVYDFLYRAQDWPVRLPHVSRLDLVEDTPGVQLMEMDTTTADGSVHTTRSVRVCFANTTIVYKQLRLPALMTVHNGRWTLEDTPAGVRATSTHTVVIKEDAVTAVLGEQATVQDAKRFVRKALGTNSTATLMRAKEYAEGLRVGR
jgi:aromatase